MRKIMFVGRSEAGKTTLKQALKGETITYHKTQYVNHFDIIIDTPGEYAETKNLAGALAVYGCEADVVGLLMNATEPFSLYPPNVTANSNREVIGVITKIDHPLADVAQAEEWLRLAGCQKIFPVCSLTGEGISDILDYLAEEGDILPWEEAKAQYDKLDFRHGDKEASDLPYQITRI
jgi:ethanolamine utilization protein EutP